MHFFQNHLLLFSATVIVTILAVRLFLLIYPKINVYIGKYNVHHLYTGAVLLVFDAVLLIGGVVNIFTVVLAGVAVGFILDELGYLITTRGGHKAYFARKSYIEMLTVLGIMLLFTFSISILLSSSGNV